MAAPDPRDHNARVYDRDRSRSSWWIGGLIAVLVIGLLAWALWPDRDEVTTTGTTGAVEVPVAPAPAAPATQP